MAVARALITGISGQDGSYLAELLLQKGYEVHGMIHDGRLGAAAHLADSIVAHRGDVRDPEGVVGVIRAASPDEVYHLAAESSPARSWERPEVTLAVVAQGTANVLAGVADEAPEARIFVAGSCEAFGEPAQAPQDELCPLAPVNPYGRAKAAATETTRAFRDERGLFAVVGILYNHESPRRPADFVTRKVTWHAAAIARGERTELHLGSLDAQRDWGYAPEYVEGAWRSLQAAGPSDYVFATGVLHSVRDLVELAFARAGVSVEDHVVVDPDLVRAGPAVPLVGDPRRARDELGWEARTTFEEVIAEMVDHDMQVPA